MNRQLHSLLIRQTAGRSSLALVIVNRYIHINWIKYTIFWLLHSSLWADSFTFTDNLHILLISLITIQTAIQGTHCWVHTTVTKMDTLLGWYDKQLGMARTIYTRYIWQGNHQTYSHIRCLNTYSWSLLRGYMYRTKYRNGICRIAIFSNVSIASELWITLRRKRRGRSWV
jgi:hypothetical protein